MKLRAASLLDLSRIEEMHRSADMTMNGADAPAARLWSLLSSTLSAFLPLSQETLIYVAEEHGKVVGYVQASGGQRGLELSRAKVLQVLNLQVLNLHVIRRSIHHLEVQHLRGLELSRAKVLQVLNLQVVDGSSDDVAPALVEHLCNQALERGAQRVFVRLP